MTLKPPRLTATILSASLLIACEGTDPSQSPVSPLASARDTTLSGVVRDANGPVPGATVRVQTTDQAVVTDSEGRFTLTGLAAGEAVALTASSPGYYIVGGDKHPPGTDAVELTLVAHASDDNPAYQWVSAFASGAEKSNCQNCHSDPGNPSSALPFDEWSQDAHALSSRNPRFLSMYTGADVNGNQSPPTRYGFNRDYGRLPLRPDPTRPYYGPGYKLDFPGTAGNCAACHAPAAAIDSPYATDPTQVSGVGAEGVACDFCHKVWSVRLDSATGQPYPNMPGVLSFEFRRPPEGHQFFAGPLDDVAPGEDTYSPLQRQSQFCAPCHFGVFWDTSVYNSFGEWLVSPYSDPQTGKTCQDCHMPQGLSDHFVRVDKGGHQRDASGIFSHRMRGAGDEDLLQNAVSLTATARLEGNKVMLEVNVTNDRSGHHVPTDSPLRQVILLVRATDERGDTLSYLDGPTVPEWGGVGDPGQGYYAGLPGKGFAKVLMELWTEITPTGAYWNPTRLVSDSRLAAFAVDESAYAFAAPPDGKANIDITLLYRRAFITLATQKRWDVPDIVMVHRAVSVHSGGRGDGVSEMRKPQ